MIEWWNSLDPLSRYASVVAAIMAVLWLRTGSQKIDIESLERRVRDLESRR
jgi:hypothetical protein